MNSVLGQFLGRMRRLIGHEGGRDNGDVRTFPHYGRFAEWRSDWRFGHRTRCFVQRPVLQDYDGPGMLERAQHEPLGVRGKSRHGHYQSREMGEGRMSAL